MFEVDLGGDGYCHANAGAAEYLVECVSLIVTNQKRWNSTARQSSLRSSIGSTRTNLRRI